MSQLISSNQVALLYLVASVLFILALKGLSHPLTARRGNRFGIVGMVFAVAVTLLITHRVDLAIGAIAVGGLLGWFVARRVEMTQMPELVAAMHSLVGLAAVLIAGAVVYNPAAFSIPDPIPAGNRVELFIGTFVGAILAAGSGRMDTGALLGAAAVALAAVNTFGGFLVTERMLEMFKKKEPKEKRR